MNKIAYTLVFLAIDTATKMLAVKLAPNNDFFILHYNPNLAMGVNSIFGYQMNMTFMKFIFPILTLALFIPLIKDQVFKQTNWAFGMLFAGMIGNYIGRFSQEGVVDFINLGFCICNLADIFQWGSYGFILILIQMNQKRALEEKRLKLI